MSKPPRNWHAVNAWDRSSAGPFIVKKEKGREFRQRVRKELAKAELDRVYGDEEILSAEQQEEIRQFLEGFTSFQSTASGLQPPDEEDEE